MKSSIPTIAKKLSFISILIGIFLVASRAGAADAAKPFLDPLFGDHMVLQRNMDAPIWGWAEPGTKVTVKINGKTFTATANAAGKWMAKVGPFKAGGPFTVVISGPAEVTLTDVLIGDVWLCSGQSNMEMGIANVTNAQEEIQNANHPRIRLFSVPKVIRYSPQEFFGPMKDGAPAWAKGRVEWLVCTPENVQKGDWGGFTAAGYFFGRKLAADLDVPIGLIQSAWGGTICEAWVSADALEEMTDFKKAVHAVREKGAAEKTGQANDNSEKETTEWYAKNDPGSREGGGWATEDFDDQSWKSMKLPVYWESAGLPDYDGIVWFRREVNIPESWAGKNLTLRLGPIDDRDTTFFDGVKVGARDFFNESRDYAIPGKLVKAGKNIIAIRVLDTGGNGGIYGQPNDLRLEVRGRRGEAPLALTGVWRYKDSMPLAAADSPVPTPKGDPGNPNVPTVLYNGMIAPLTPLAIKGAIWYQGESNAGRGYQYRSLLATMIRDWRARFDGGDFPFFIVQLAGFTAVQPDPTNSTWAEIREAQQWAAQAVGDSATASAVDIGDAKDIHPKNKQEVGRRLALCAEAIACHKKVEFEGPTFNHMEIKGSQAIIHFDHLGAGLEAGGNALKGFSIAGPDGHFVWANASIDGKTVVVSSDKVSQPTAVRYAWADNPEANLYNKAGLPANAFRTDIPK